MKHQKRTRAIQTDRPVFRYVSTCCSVSATKTPCVKVDKKTSETQGLGKFRCTACRKRCQCTRTKNPLDKEATA